MVLKEDEDGGGEDGEGGRKMSESKTERDQTKFTS